jgi:hypothetical protein
MTAGALGAAVNVKSYGSPVKTRTDWASKAREIAVAIARLVNDQSDEMFAVSCERPA